MPWFAEWGGIGSAFESRTGPLPVHPALGPLTRDEWVRFHLRHCELHLGHLAIDAAG